jgi:hypothetical protein
MTELKFIQLTVQEKGPEDFRAFVYYKESVCSDTYELRGYGSSVIGACADAMSRFSELEAEAELENVEWQKNKPEKKLKTYSDILTLLKNTGENKLCVAVIYANDRHEWLPIDKKEYIQQLEQIHPESANTTTYPCFFGIENDGSMLIYPKWENT